MITRNHILIGIVAALAVIGGLLVGLYFHNQNTISRPTDSSVAQTAPIAKIEKNSNLYDISPPSRGSFSETISIDLQSVNQNQASAIIPSERAGQIKTGQNVLLYRADGMLLEIMGGITSIEPADDKTSLSMIINADAEHPATQATRGEIIIANNNSAQRLPLSSLSTDADGNNLLWEVLKNTDGTQSVKSQKANVVSRTYDFIVIEQPDFTSNVYVLNPDTTLADGQEIQTRTVLYAAPAETAEMKVLRAIDDRTPRIAGDPYKGPIPDSPCAIAAANPENSGSPASPACGQSTDALTDFIQKIRQNTRADAAQP